MGAELKNVNILLCLETFGEYKNIEKHLNTKFPLIAQNSEMKNHLIFFRGYMNYKFFLTFWLEKLHITSPFQNEVFEKRKMNYDFKSNQIYHNELDLLIRTDSLKYFSNNIFKNRQYKSKVYPKKLYKLQQNIFRKIAAILERNNSNVKVIISPLYNFDKINPQDLKFLSKVFGSNVYDFSGLNFLSRPISNWYETFHYRPSVGKQILKKIYNE
jgi:hypothetical protein